MSTLERVLTRAVRNGWIQPTEVDAVRSRIGQLAAKWQFSTDDFAVFSLIESYGLNPRADNGNCYGIIQFCNGTGLATIGKTRSQVLNASVLQQLDFVDRYWEGPPRLRRGSDLVDLYLSVLYPAGTSVRDPNAPIPVPGRQAAILYDSSGRITRNSIRAGLLKNAERMLGSPVSASSAPPPGLPGDYTNTGSSVGSAAGQGLTTATVTVKRTNCQPPNPNQIDYITYTGCENLFVQRVGGAGLGAGAAAPGVAGIGDTAAVTTGAKPYEGLLPSGAFFANPMKPNSYTVSSPYGPRNGRLHAGIDMAAPVGTPIYAAADGTVIEVCLERGPDGCGRYGVVIYIRHSNGWTTRYAHLDKVFVRKNQTVKKQDQIALSGNTGSSTGPHLHFETRRPDGRPVNPQSIIPIR